jgi:hypothetical protein
MNSMDYGPRCEATGFSVSQQMLCIMKPERSLSCSVDPAICTCPTPDYKTQTNFLQAPVFSTVPYSRTPVSLMEETMFYTHIKQQVN